MKFKHITLALLLAGTSVFAQIKVNQTPTVDGNSNAFLDASENVSNFGNNIGRGLLFPPTDLSTFKLDKDALDGINYPTYFNGMIVYNTHEGGKTTDPNIQSTDDLSVGYYYFSNPEGVKTQSIAKGKWIKISDAQATANLYTQNGTLTENRTVSLDNKTLAFTGGQIGINTEKPKATLDIQSKDGINNGILIPRVTSAQRDAYDKPERGLMVYNTDKKCYETNTGTATEPKWTCLAVADDTQLLKIEPVGFKGNFRYAYGNDNKNRKVIFKVTNNTGSKLTNLDLSYIEVEGINQYIAPGQHTEVTLEPYESKELEYLISGGNWSNATFTLKYDEYSKGSIFLNIDWNLNNNGAGIGNSGKATFYNTEKKFFMVKQVVGGTTIDKSKEITSTRILKVEIPFKDGTGNYLAYDSGPVDIIDADGNPRQIKLTYPEGNLNPGTGIIEATIEPVDGVPVKLAQTELGQSKVVAHIPLRLNDSDQGFFDIIAFGGITDRRFGDGSGHDFVYMPIVSPAGRTWLNNNLGAEYTRIDSDVFDPEKMAQQPEDKYARGSRFQSYRGPDGHELTKVNEQGNYVTLGEIVYELASSFQPNTTKIYYDPLSREANYRDRRYEWVDFSKPENKRADFDRLWDLNGANNPCPEGYYVPKYEDFTPELNLIKRKNTTGLFEYPLRISTEFAIVPGANYIFSNPSTIKLGGNSNMYTKNIRCIKSE